MKPIFDTRSEWKRVRVLGQRGLIVLALLLGLCVVQADTTNFVGDFGPTLWTLQPDHGSVFFTDEDQTLVLTGPNQPTTEIPQSLDVALYSGPSLGGLRVGGTVEFHWAYYPGAVESASADIAWAPPGGANPTQSPLILTGGQGFESGDFSTNLLAGTTFEFLLTTHTLADKLSGTLIITGFQFHDIPEPPTGTLLISLVISLCLVRWRRGQVQAPGQP
jgi:hypothetical protein